jgi:hypothetical protein
MALTPLNGKWIDYGSTVTNATGGVISNLSTTDNRLIRFTAASTIDSLAGGLSAGNSLPRELLIVNATGGSLIVKNEGSGTAANRILTGTGADVTLTANATVYLRYDSAASRWLMIGGPATGTGGGGGTVSYMKRAGGTTGGSTNNYVVCYSVAVESVGSSITYQADSTNGDSFKATVAGVYTINAQGYSVSSGTVAIKRGTTINNTFTIVETPSELVAATNGGSGGYFSVSGQAYMQVNDLIWINGVGTNSNASFVTITGPH